jgi:cell division transport system ATP-binding protein
MALAESQQLQNPPGSAFDLERSGTIQHDPLTDPGNPEPSAGVRTPGTLQEERPPALLLEAVRRTHPGAVAPTLEGLDLRVEQGEFVALTGESGSGKSTIIGLCSARQQADAGRIGVFGKDITRIGNHRRSELRRRVATIFQDYELLPDRSAAENVAFTLEISGLSVEERRERADEALELVGLSARADALPSQLSGGEQQRVAVARALALRPSIILADEPTGNLDEENGEMIFDLLLTLNGTGTTVLVATHDVGLVTRLGLRTMRIHDGRLRTYRGPQAAGR